jgi:pyruvate formate lyase activating enzyme
MTGTIYNIQRFSIHDGPGIRTTVFFKGCPLRCLWCHNPESISPKPQLEFYPERCIGCGRCFDACPNHAHGVDGAGVHFIDRALCNGCLRCVDSCYAEALVGVGRRITVEELMKSVSTDIPYYEGSGGGVTFSGGECMAQLDFLEQALEACQDQGIHTAVDTAGSLPWSSFERILAHTDLFLYDLKAVDEQTHRRLTGSGNAHILENLRSLSQAGKRIFVRIPYIPGCNDGEIDAMARILAPLNIERVEVLGYHRLGEGKYAALGLSGGEHFAVPTPQALQAAADKLCAAGVNALVP